MNNLIKAGVIVDDEDLHLLTDAGWYIDKQGYVRKNIHLDNGKRTTTTLGQVLKGRKGYHTDHINRNTLDNRKENLRVATSMMNQLNSKCVGVRVRSNGFQARLRVKKVLVSLGVFSTYEEAKKVYLEAREKELSKQEQDLAMGFFVERPNE